MTDAFVGEIRRFGGDFAPAGWLLCDGRLVDAAAYGELFAVIGTRFGGGDGTFGLPNLNHVAKSTSDVAYIIATTGRLPVRPQLRVEL